MSLLIHIYNFIGVNNNNGHVNFVFDFYFKITIMIDLIMILSR